METGTGTGTAFDDDSVTVIMNIHDCNTVQLQ